MKPTDFPIDPLIPIKEAFRKAGMGPTKGYQEVAKGRLPVVRNGRRTFARATALQRYIDSLTAESSKPEKAA